MTADSPVEPYRARRDFARTPEPQGGRPVPDTDRPIFVIQEHDATTLHYDFRLEVGGVLKSWAVPKGPSTDPRQRRLAVPTEDHPMAYANFEGLIPKGQYGAGPVLVWDRGYYRNLRAETDGADMARSLAEGKVEVWLEGRKLRGGYALIRVAKADAGRWLLIKLDDAEADARRQPTRSERQSVLTRRTIEEVARDGKDAR
jgi:DNA ligase D-like protein (predicted 3'-phosphoesterase)